MKIVNEVFILVHISYLPYLFALARHWVGLGMIRQILIWVVYMYHNVKNIYKGSWNVRMEM